MPEGREFTISVSKEGFFLVYAGSNERIQLTREQFDEYISQSKITESYFTVNPGHYGEWLSMQIERYIEQRDAGKSQYGERVILQPVDVKETVNGEAVSIHGSWQCFTESGTYLHDTTLNIEDLTGPVVQATINARLSVAEILKTIIQLEMSGASATDEDEKPLETVFEFMEKQREGRVAQ